MNIQDIDILTLIPQRRPFILVDRLLSYQEDKVETSFAVPKNHIFCESGFLNEAGIIENMAQTCAVRLGYINVYIKHKKVNLGFIGSIRHLEILTLPKINDVLHTEIEILEEVFQLSLVKATVRVNDEIIATGEMKISDVDTDSKVE
jgi:predicted hotdog family 3-hydroxylacyl-ACP dehydratase